MGGVARRLTLVAAALALIVSLAPAVVLAAEPTFGKPTAKSEFGTGITFSQPVEFSEPVDRVEILLTFADAIGPTVTEMTVPADGTVELNYTYRTAGELHLIPNTPVRARYRVFLKSDPDHGILSPEVEVVYADDRFAWKTVSSDLVRVHYYEGNETFARKALKLGEDEVRDTSSLLGVTETEPVDFFVYANRDDFYGALGPGAHENVAGTAYAYIRTLLGLIPPDQIDDPLVAVRIPHEFVHLVFDTASSNPYHGAPRWLNEGLAVYQSEGYGRDDRAAVEDAARGGTLIPLDGLTGQFPNGQDFFLAYSESVAAVDYMVRTHGRDALVTLIRSYADGKTDDEAFTAALGLDMTDFGEAWFTEVKAKAPTKYGPQPAPPGPVPAAWAAGGPVVSADGGGGGFGVIAVVAAVAAVIVIAVLAARSRRRATEAAG